MGRRKTKCRHGLKKKTQRGCRLNVIICVCVPYRHFLGPWVLWKNLVCGSKLNKAHNWLTHFPWSFSDAVFCVVQLVIRGEFCFKKIRLLQCRSFVDFYHKIFTSYQKTPFLYKWRCVRAHTRAHSAQVTLPPLHGPLEGFPTVSGWSAHGKCGKQRGFIE